VTCVDRLTLGLRSCSGGGRQDRVAEARPRLVTRPLLLRFVTVIGSSASFYLLLSVVPAYAQSAPGGGSDKAGLVSAVPRSHGDERG
jgi:hypothetical protein